MNESLSTTPRRPMIGPFGRVLRASQRTAMGAPRCMLANVLQGDDVACPIPPVAPAAAAGRAPKWPWPIWPPAIPNVI